MKGINTVDDDDDPTLKDWKLSFPDNHPLKYNPDQAQ